MISFFKVTGCFFFFFLYENKLISLFRSVWGLRCCKSVSLVAAGERGHLSSCRVSASHHRGLSCGHWLWALGLQYLQLTGSVLVVHGLSCSTARGIFLNQGGNPGLLHWQADSLSLSHQGGANFNHFVN